MADDLDWSAHHTYLEMGTTCYADILLCRKHRSHIVSYCTCSFGSNLNVISCKIASRAPSSGGIVARTMGAVPSANHTRRKRRKR